MLIKNVFKDPENVYLLCNQSYSTTLEINSKFFKIKWLLKLNYEKSFQGSWSVYNKNSS